MSGRSVLALRFSYARALAVINGGSVVVTYRDQSPSRTIEARIKVESEVPSFSNTIPAKDTTTNDLNTVLSTEVVDRIAGVNPSSVSVSVLCQRRPCLDQARRHQRRGDARGVRRVHNLVQH